MPETKTRRLRRFFSTAIYPSIGKELLLNSAESRHLKVVLRLREGDGCLLINQEGVEAEARVIAFAPDGNARLRLVRVLKTAPRQDSILAHVYVAIPQRAKMDWIVEKAQELGIFKMIPIETERTVVKMSAEAKKKVLMRWERIAREAAKQAGSAGLVKIKAPIALKNAVELIPSGEEILFFHPNPEASRFKDWLREKLLNCQPSEFKSVHVFLGPEGGFSKRDWDIVRTKNARMIYLGETVLKVETAVVAVASAIQYCLQGSVR